MTRLLELCEAIRSKNVKQYYITFDIMVKDYEKYKRVKNSGVLNEELITKLYHRKPMCFSWFDQTWSLKITLKRKRPNGNIGDPDVFGNGQSALLWDLEIP